MRLRPSGEARLSPASREVGSAPMAADAREAHLKVAMEKRGGRSESPANISARSKMNADGEHTPITSPRELNSLARRVSSSEERLERATSQADAEDKCASSPSKDGHGELSSFYQAGSRQGALGALAALGKRLRVFFAVITWFIFNISMGTLIKWTYLYGKVCDSSGECRAYEFPFFVTAIHMLFSWLVCLGLVLNGVTQAIRFSFRDQAKSMAPLALCFSAAVGLGNLSLTYIYPSFNQMLSSLSPLVTVGMAVLMRGKRYNAWTWGSMPLICGGLLVCSVKEVNYNLKGVICVIGATVLRAVKSVMQESLLDQKLDSITLLFYLAPWAGGFLLLMSLVCEGLEPYRMLLPQDPMDMFAAFRAESLQVAELPAGGERSSGKGLLAALLVASGVNACFLNLCGNQVTAYCGAVMLQILGNVKACVAIAVSAFILGNAVTPHQVAGVVVSLFGVWVYQKKGGTVVPKASVSSSSVAPAPSGAGSAPALPR